MTPPAKGTLFALGNYFHEQFVRLRAKEDVDPVKLAEAKGKLDAADYFLGKKTPPANLDSE
jgi:hypothetical protein